MAVSNDMATDRRVDRHCRALAEAGCEVVVVCRQAWEGEALAGETGCGAYEVRRVGVRHRRGWRFYAELNRAIVWAIVEAEPDVVWANDTDTLLGCHWAVERIRREYGRRPLLVMDAHELFPEVPELEGRGLVKRVWRGLERWLMPKCDVRFTVSQGIADYYGKRYGVEMKVVRNVPPMAAVGSGMRTEKKNMLLYQGCINRGRGVDWAIEAMQWLEGCELVIAGGGDLETEMRALAESRPWRERIRFTGRISPEALAELTRQAAVGLVMLEDRGLSYHYALPNRVGDFVAAGVPMVVSDLPEMAAVVRRYGVGEVMAEPGARALAEAVKWVLAREWSEADFAQARREMDWEQEKLILTETIKTRLAG
ncbi:MAG: glycosyltransferase [Bacteroidales bacterium]|nr:glycosyltransferase [Bacteroidales bacterium]